MTAQIASSGIPANPTVTAKFPSVTIHASSARTATPSASDIHDMHIGAHIIIDVTAVSATPSVVPVIQGLDEVSGKYYAILTGIAITATGTTVLKVGPNIQALANGAAKDFLPAIWRVTMTHGDSDSITYSVSYNGTG